MIKKTIVELFYYAFLVLPVACVGHHDSPTTVGASQVGVGNGSVSDGDGTVAAALSRATNIAGEAFQIVAAKSAEALKLDALACIGMNSRDCEAISNLSDSQLTMVTNYLVQVAPSALLAMPLLHMEPFVGQLSATDPRGKSFPVDALTDPDAGSIKFAYSFLYDQTKASANPVGLWQVVIHEVQHAKSVKAAITGNQSLGDFTSVASFLGEDSSRQLIIASSIIAAAEYVSNALPRLTCQISFPNGLPNVVLGPTGAPAQASAGVDFKVSLTRASSHIDHVGVTNGSVTTFDSVSMLGTAMIATSGSPSLRVTLSEAESGLKGSCETAVALTGTKASLPYADSFSAPDSPTLSKAWDVSPCGVSIVKNHAVLEGASCWSRATLLGVAATDVTVSADVTTSGATSSVGLVARYSGPGDNNMYYGLVGNVDGQQYVAQIYRALGGTWTQLVSAPISSAAGRLVFDVRGSSLTLSLNGSPVVGITDDTITSPGSVGIRGGPVPATYQNFAASVLAPAMPASLPYSDSFALGASGKLGASWVTNFGGFAIAKSLLLQIGNFTSTANLAAVKAADVVVTANVRVTNANDCAAVTARYTGPGDQNSYAAGICMGQTGAPGAIIWRNVGGVWTTLVWKPIAIATGTISFNVSGSALRLDINGAAIVSATDTAITSPGSVGVRISGARTVMSGFSATALR